MVFARQSYCWQPEAMCRQCIQSSSLKTAVCFPTAADIRVAVLFVSHSSKDDALATALEAWLKANGFSDVFVDHHSIAGGDKWRDALRAASGSCRVVVCLITENWLASSECFHEFGTAWGMGKRIIPLFLLPSFADLGTEAKTRLDRVCGEDQGIDLKPCVTASGMVAIDADQNVASRLRIGLRAAGANSRVGLDPEAFAIDIKLRPTPFPGLSSFGDDDADAALFYGRSREIAHTLEDLRSMRALNDQRPLVIQGASGAGKSSLLKAGIISRLRRETPAWLPLRAFRPGADPLLNFAEALAGTFADFGRTEAHGVIRDRLMGVWSKAERADKGDLTPGGLAVLEAGLEAEGQALRNAAARPNGTLALQTDRIFADVSGAEPSGPDGMKVDTAGNIYCGGSGGIYVLDPNGKKLGRIVHGRPETTNIAFGGDDWKTLYFTNWYYLGAVNLKIPGLPVPTPKKS
jgi:Novel STAND NTPase 1/TIR domain/SMP-30/Gluconolactonase/LRE-like region